MGLLRDCVIDLTRGLWVWRKVHLKRYDDVVIALEVGNILE